MQEFEVYEDSNASDSQCDWDYFDSSFITRSSSMFHSPLAYRRSIINSATPSPEYISRKTYKHIIESDTGTDEDSATRFGGSSSESSNSGLHAFPRRRFKNHSSCCLSRCENCGNFPEKQYIPIPVPVPIPIPVPSFQWNPNESIIVYNPDEIDSTLQLRLQSIQQNMNGKEPYNPELWLWPYTQTAGAISTAFIEGRHL